MRPLKVCIDARLVSGGVGGVEQFIIGLGSGLSKLLDGPEEYLFLTYSDSRDWISPYVSGNCKILEDVSSPTESLARRTIKRKLPELFDLLHSVDPRIYTKSISQERSNGLIEKIDVDIMHFTMQNAFLTSIPSIYHPHDLQHIHLPELFSVRRRVLRDQMYKTFCNQATMVAVSSNFVKNDLMQNYHLSPDKIKVIPLAPVVSTYSEPTSHDLANLRVKYCLPEKFLFYPAQTWPHKNHKGLLNALALLKNRKGLEVHGVFSGRKDNFFSEIEIKVKELGLQNQVSFLDFVSPNELRSLYKLSYAVVIPTKFEAGSFPLWEAFVMGVPAACSNVTSLPEQAGDSALLFDPDRPEEIAAQIFRLWTDENLRKELVEKGRFNVSRFSWERTARIFRAHYRRLARETLEEEDKKLLETPSLL